jgi:hypothetical protein
MLKQIDCALDKPGFASTAAARLAAMRIIYTGGQCGRQYGFAVLYLNGPGNVQKGDVRQVGVTPSRVGIVTRNERSTKFGWR